jgi:hypothetical protein
VGRRTLPALFVAFAVIAELDGADGLARNALLAALPFASVAALVAFGGYIDSRERFDGLQSLCSGLIVVLLVLSCAVRSSAAHGVPAAAVSSLIGVVSLFALKGALSAAPYWRRLGSLSPAKP